MRVKFLRVSTNATDVAGPDLASTGTKADSRDGLKEGQTTRLPHTFNREGASSKSGKKRPDLLINLSSAFPPDGGSAMRTCWSLPWVSASGVRASAAANFTSKDYAVGQLPILIVVQTSMAMASRTWKISPCA